MRQEGSRIATVPVAIKGPDGKLAITLPMDDKRLPGIAAEDIGKLMQPFTQLDNVYHRKHPGTGRAIGRGFDAGAASMSKRPKTAPKPLMTREALPARASG